jgi:hypothetical protein
VGYSALGDGAKDLPAYSRAAQAREVSDMRVDPRIGDVKSRRLADRLRRDSKKVTEPQATTVIRTLRNTVFISHTSLDHKFVVGEIGKKRFSQESIWGTVGEKFCDPFYHSMKTGGAEGYVRMVGLALLSATRVLIVWSENALRSDFVRAEVLIATGGGKQVGVYMMPNAPPFPIACVQVVQDCKQLSEMLESWKNKSHFAAP